MLTLSSQLTHSSPTVYSQQLFDCNMTKRFVHACGHYVVHMAREQVDRG